MSGNLLLLDVAENHNLASLPKLELKIVWLGTVPAVAGPIAARVRERGGTWQAFADLKEYHSRTGAHSAPPPEICMVDQDVAQAAGGQTPDPLWKELFENHSQRVWVVVAPQANLSEVERYYSLGAAGVVRATTIEDFWGVILQCQRVLHSQISMSNNHPAGMGELTGLWEQAFSACRVAAWSWEVGGIRGQFSRNLPELMGFQAGDYERLSRGDLEIWLEHIHPEDHEQFSQTILRCLNSHEPYSVEYRVRNAQGKSRWLMSRGGFVSDALGQSRLQGITADISDRKQAQIALADSEQRFREFMDNSQCVAFIKNREGYYVYVNRNFRELLFANPPPIIGQHDREIYPPEVANRLREQDLKIWHSRAPWSGMEDVPIATGELRHWWSVKFILKNSYGDEFLGGMAIDITPQLQAEDQTRTLLEELSHLSRLATMGQLVAELAHELNQPLYAASNYTEASLNQLRQTGRASAELLGWMTEVSVQIRRMNEIIRRVSGFGSRGPESPQICQLNELIMECHNLLQVRLRKAPIRLIYNLDPNLPQILAQPLQLQQVLINLVTNALDALLTVAVDNPQISIRTWKNEGQSVGLEVADNGPGVSAERMARIFEPFYTTKPEGVGLGLSISKSIVEAHGGKLTALPNQPRGLKFQMEFPVEHKAYYYAPISTGVGDGT
ncbi:MAG: ATP-binding protein [Pirellulales bacterium]|nr:ATP-binding protein [Pirellulales bacterium]